jgi:hypothetical protein
MVIFRKGDFMTLRQRVKHWKEYLRLADMGHTDEEAKHYSDAEDLINDLLTEVENIEAERDLFKKETLALVSHAEKFRLGLDRVIDAGSEGCCKYCDIKTDIAKEALEI